MPPALTKKLWTEVTASEHAHERAALHFIRERFPPREPFRAWANFTFLADDGTRNEVDLLVVSPTGVYLVEIKSYPGRIDGDAGTWVWTSPDGYRKTLDNPLILSERKAKKLKSLLMRQKALRDRTGPQDGFFLRSVVFLSEPNLIVGLNDPGRTDVFGPDPSPNDETPPNRLPGIVRLFTRVDPRRGRQVDRPLSAAIAEAVDSAGIRESTTHRRVGEYEFGELIDEGEGWQDFEAAHPTIANTYRRTRLYLTGRSLDEEERSTLVRAAEREFKFLQQISHPAIDGPLEILRSPRGPVLVFRHDRGARRLDHWLADHGADLDLLDRVELVRQVAEGVRHAHRQGLYHRALSPRSIWITERAGEPTVRIRDWQTAARDRTTSLSASTGTLHVAERVSESARIYLAPETTTVPDALAAPADIWSLGAVSALILSGSPPAPDLDGLHSQLRENGYLTLAACMDAPPAELDRIIRSATAAEASERFVSVDEFLEFLDLALEDLTAPEERDPLDANRGDPINDRWVVERRVGSGRTSVVLLVDAGDRKEILKIARTEEHAELLKHEFEILSSLRDRSIIEPYGLERIGGRTVLRLEPALWTLGDAIRQEGALSLDLLERFGRDLLGAVAHLDAEGVAHRDLKPDNIGIAERGKDRERHLVLFDFSLSRTDPSEIRVGTPGYLDPFLEERDPRRWDDQAERYAVAVTLYEMATGTRPVWGDGSTDPLLTDRDTPAIETDLMDSSVREPLESFFRRALHRRPAHRFDTIGQMERVWEEVFAGIEQSTPSGPTVSIEDIDVRDVSATTALVELGVSPRVRNALDRLAAVTAGDLARMPPSHLVRLGGIGAATRRDVTHLAQRVREALGDAGVPTDAGAASIDRIAERLVPQPPADEDHRTVIASLLELVPEPSGPWPTYGGVADAAALHRSLVGDALASARERWRRQSELTSVRSEIAELLVRRGGVMGAEELAGTLLASRGSLASEPLRSRRARATIRAAAETEGAMRDPRFVIRRLGTSVLVALDGRVSDEEGEHSVWDAERLIEAAAALGERAVALAAQEPLPSAEQVIRGLRDVAVPDGVGPFGDTRLVRLAASAAEGVAVSTRLELYLRGMTPERAVQECRALLLDRRGLTASEVRSRVRARYPEAAEMPGRPQLDSLLEPLGLRWHEAPKGDGRYQMPQRSGVLSTYVSTTAKTTIFSSADERDAATRELDHRLDALRTGGGFLALTVGRRRYAGSADVIAAQLGAKRLDLDATLLQAMHALSDELGARWEAFLDADNRRGQQQWTRLQQLLDRVLPAVEEQVLASDGLLVLTGFGLLARYDRSGVLANLRDAMTHRAHSHRLSGVVLMIPGDDPTSRPVVDGMPIPVITANQWGHVPSAWLSRIQEDEAA